ncbi:MAG TPA: hypothetical protein GXX75_09620 [Clostridiales bacterium]|nr:hypothetical protein [Clostridiales bacterium]
MRNKLDEKLLILAKAQECMTYVADTMERWDNSQFNVEKIAYESINLTDMVMNMSKEGCRLALLLQEYYNESSLGASADKYLKMTAFLEEIKNLFQNISEIAAVENDISHQMEEEIAGQRELQEDIKCNLCQIGESLDLSVASAELILSEL